MVRVWDSVPTSTVIESWADRIVNQIRFQDGQSCTFDEVRCMYLFSKRFSLNGRDILGMPTRFGLLLEGM